MHSEKILLQGNEACVEGAIMAGMRFFAGYPITPSTEIAEKCSVRLPQVGGHFIQMEDEISSLAAVIGASVVGTKAMTATSGPGFSLMQENIGYACMAEIPCVIIDVQRCGPSTGLATSPSQGDYMQAKWGTHGDHPIIAVSPSSVKECMSLMIRAFNLSEKYRTPVIFLTDEIVAHMREGVDPEELGEITLSERKLSGSTGEYNFAYAAAEDRLVPQARPFGQGQRYNITGLMHDDSGFPSNSTDNAEHMMERVNAKISRNLDDILSVEEYRMEDAEIAVVCFGATARAAMPAILAAREKGIKVGMFRPITVWPFPESYLEKRVPQLKGVIMAEHNNGQMLREVSRVVAKRCRVEFIGRLNGTVIPPEEILSRIEEVHADAE